MDSLITGAARALAAGDPLAALRRIALRDDAPALALRGIAMAQLGDYERSRLLLRRAARRFGPLENLARARCQVAAAEVALAARDLKTPNPGLEATAQALETHGDIANARHARLLAARRALLLGDVGGAEAMLAKLGPNAAPMSPTVVARTELTRAELALRQVRVAEAAAALHRARAAALASGVPALVAEVERTQRALEAPAARIVRAGQAHVLRLDEVEVLLASGDVVVDGCRRAVRAGPHQVALAGRPVLFELARSLAEAWPAEVTRDDLIARTFGARMLNPSHRARLRVEISRLRGMLRSIARIEATARGFGFTPRRKASVVVLVPPMDGPAGAVRALLEDGESWSTSALAHALGASQRTVQRLLRQLEDAAAVRSVGDGRSRRWVAPTLGGFATTLLLPGSLGLR